MIWPEWPNVPATFPLAYLGGAGHICKCQLPGGVWGEHAWMQWAILTNQTCSVEDKPCGGNISDQLLIKVYSAGCESATLILITTHPSCIGSKTPITAAGRLEQRSNRSHAVLVSGAAKMEPWPRAEYVMRTCWAVCNQPARVWAKTLGPERNQSFHLNGKSTITRGV